MELLVWHNLLTVEVLIWHIGTVFGHSSMAHWYCLLTLDSIAHWHCLLAGHASMAHSHCIVTVEVLVWYTDTAFSLWRC